MSVRMKNEMTREEFIARLVNEAGWSHAQAEAEWNEIQNEEEGEL